MTPDRNDQNPDEETENGVLAETEGLDTTALGILGGGTEQVSVMLPSSSDDEELDDDDVVGDEVEVEAIDVEFSPRLERPAYEAAWLGQAAGELAEAEAEPEPEPEPVEVDEPIEEAEPMAADVPVGEAVLDAEPVDEAAGRESEIEVVHVDLVEADVADDAAGADAEPASQAEVVEDAEIVADEAQAEEDTPASALADDTLDEDADDTVDEDQGVAVIVEAFDDDGLVDSELEGDDDLDLDLDFDDTDDIAESGGRTDSTVEAEIVTEQQKPESLPTTTGSNPTTRREANADAVDKLERAHSLERVQPRPDVTLTSKRLGEFEPGRESADLLTADRLLDPHQVVRPEPEGAWQHFVYSITGHRVNLGDGKRARARKELDRRISAALGGGARFVPVLSRKGGVGKTTVTTLLGMALADARDDRIIAVDANPDRGTLADRIARQNGKTVRDLARARGEISGYAGISSIVARDDTRLDVLASDADPRVSEAFSDKDYHDVAAIAAHYYSIVLTDTGTGIVHSVMQATLELADQLVIVSGLSVEEARLASETLTWLETNGYAEQVRSAVVVLNNARPGTPLVRLDELETHFSTRVRAVVRMPYDPLIAAGSAIAFRDLKPQTRLAARELAACIVEGLRALAPAA
ncbi:MinD/ParA family protein [Microbacterium sp. B2969]|uniref:MinD/ParA family protein n=1 Tax=Microbacterium alkaliflavum TaxID=3248839 RepID=A0ABW7QDH8_9MICO